MNLISKSIVAILIFSALLISGCTSSNVNQVGKGVHDEQCRVDRDACDSLCNQQPDSEQAGCKAKCDSDYYTCENS